MNKIPLEQLDQRLSNALEEQTEHQLLRLTRDSNTVAYVLRLPEAMRDAEPDGVFFSEGPSGRIVVIVEARHVPAPADEKSNEITQPVFGAGHGTLTILSDDDDHLKDFKEYME